MSKVNDVTVGMLTFNTVKKIGGTFLRLVIHRACVELPIRRLIIINAGGDDAVNIIKDEASRHNVPVTVLNDKVHSRGYSRWLALRAFSMLNDGGLFMFLDDDAVLRHGWWRESYSLINSGCGAVWGVNYDAYNDRVKVLEAFNIDYVNFLKYEYMIRGGTHDLLLTRNAVNTLLNAPPPLIEYEDAYIHWLLHFNNVKECINDIGVIHLNPNSLSMNPMSIIKMLKTDSFTKLMKKLEYSAYRGRGIRLNADSYTLMRALIIRLLSLLHYR